MNVLSLIQRATLILGVLMFSCVSTFATEQTLKTYLSSLKQHPSVIYWLERKRAVDALSLASTGLPDPQIVVGLENVPVDTFSFNDYLPTSKVIGLRQQIPNKQNRRSQAAKKKQMGQLYQLQADYQFHKLYALFNIQLIKLKENRALESINENKRSLYWSVEEDLKGQLEAGGSVYGRLSEIDIDRTDIDHQLNELKAKRIAIESELIRLVGEVPESSSLLPTYLLSSYAPITWDPATTALYPIEIAQEQVQVALHERTIADAAFKPNYSLQALYKQRSSSDHFDGDDWFSLQASISIPFWSATNQTPKREAAEFHIKSVQWQLDDTKMVWQKRLSALQAKRDTALNNIALLEKNRASLDQIVLAAKRNYESGHSRLAPVLSAQIDQLSLKERLIQEKSLYQVLSAQYVSHFVPDPATYSTPQGGAHDAL